MASNEPPTGNKVRTLTEVEEQKLAKDTNLVSEFKQMKLEKEAQKNWDLFYKRNTTKFFKDRHWTTREFHELCGKREEDEKLKILEVGCGVGNFVFPLLEEDETLYFYACDFSPRAVQFVKDRPLYSSTGRCHAFQCDLTKDDLTCNVTEPVHLVTMVFVLSAIHPDAMLRALKNVYNVLCDDGMVLFRDYGQYDYAQLRFAPGHKLMDNFYVRQDGTRAYYFTEEKLASLFLEAGFSVVSNNYIMRETVNKKEGVCVPRIFLQSKFRKNKPATKTHGDCKVNEDAETILTNCIQNESPSCSASNEGDACEGGGIKSEDDLCLNSNNKSS